MSPQTVPIALKRWFIAFHILIGYMENQNWQSPDLIDA